MVVSLYLIGKVEMFIVRKRTQTIGNICVKQYLYGYCDIYSHIPLVACTLTSFDKVYIFSHPIRRGYACKSIKQY